MQLGTIVTDGEQKYEIVAYKPRSSEDIYELYDFDNREQFDVLESKLRTNFDIVS